MKPNIATLFFSLSASLLVLSGCGKDDDNKQEPVCKIVTSSQGNSVQTLAYDEQRRISRVTNSTGVNVLTIDFTYFGNQVANKYNYNGNVVIADTITLNAKGMITKIHSSYPKTSAWEDLDLAYNANDELSTITSTSSSSSTPEVVTYTYSNGNIVAAVTPTGTITYQYDLTRLSQQGDYPSFNESSRFSTRYTRSKNLMTSYKKGSDETDLTYTFDAEGRIATMTVSNALNGTYSYQYDCK